MKKRFPPAGTKRTAAASVDTLPEELLLEVFTYLTAADLLTCARVCKRWLSLAKDNLLWERIYKRYANEVKPAGPGSLSGPAYWKSQCIKRCREIINTKVLPLLKKVDGYTGLPVNTRRALDKAGVRFLLCFEDQDGVDHVMPQNDTYHFRMCACARWYGMTIPPLHRIKKLKIYSANPVFFERTGAPAANSPYQRSLLFETDFKWDNWTKDRQPVAGDKLINIHVIPGDLLIATWKEGGDIAFVTASLHSNHLVRRCLLGSSSSIYTPPRHIPVKDDIDPKYGLHGYTCTMELRNQRSSIWSQQFRNLYTKDGHMGDGVAKLVLVDQENDYDRSSVANRIAMLWKTDAFKGAVKNVCFLDMTLLDETSKPMWCVSSVVTLTSPQHNDVTYSFMGTKLQMSHRDEAGQVIMNLSWEAEEEKYFMTGLEIFLNLSHINQWFGTTY